MRAALGLRAHSGWAALVAVGGSVEAPIAIDRRRISLAESGLSETFQPYHAAQRMKLEEAGVFLACCADSSGEMARKAIQEVVRKLASEGHHTAGACVLWGSGTATLQLAAILASHPRLHTAEGELFREALRCGCESCGLPVVTVREREISTRSAALLGISPLEVERRSAAMGKSIGPPWRQDEKLCALAGLLVLKAD